MIGGIKGIFTGGVSIVKSAFNTVEKKTLSIFGKDKDDKDKEKIESKEQLLDQEEDTLFIITQGGLVTKDNQRIVWPGDVCDGKTLSRLANAFDIDVFTSMIIIK